MICPFVSRVPDTSASVAVLCTRIFVLLIAMAGSYCSTAFNVTAAFIAVSVCAGLLFPAGTSAAVSVSLAAAAGLLLVMSEVVAILAALAAAGKWHSNRNKMTRGVCIRQGSGLFCTFSILYQLPFSILTVSIPEVDYNRFLVVYLLSKGIYAVWPTRYILFFSEYCTNFLICDSLNLQAEFISMLSCF